jgi:hypothetical protein
MMWNQNWVEIILYWAKVWVPVFVAMSVLFYFARRRYRAAHAMIVLGVGLMFGLFSVVLSYTLYRQEYQYPTELIIELWIGPYDGDNRKNLLAIAGIAGMFASFLSLMYLGPFLMDPSHWQSDSSTERHPFDA